jgi:hypothetical protein
MLKGRKASADESHVHRARRMMNASVVLAAFGALTIATVSHRSEEAPSSKTRAMIYTIQPVEYCVEGKHQGPMAPYELGGPSR